MFGYYLKLALRSLRRNRGLTVVMVLALALGIGATMTTLTVYSVLSNDPLPGRSARLFYVQLDPTSSSKPDADPPEQLTRYDAEELLRQARGKRQAVMTAGNLIGRLPNTHLPPMMLPARYTSADFFPMFAVPIAAGRAWTGREDGSRARVAVVSAKLAKKLFGDGSAVGRTLNLEKNDFKIVGVLGDYAPTPRFYDMSTGPYSEVESVFVPFSTSRELKFDTQGSMNCWGHPPQNEEGTRSLDAPCAWLQYWVELEKPSDASAFLKYLQDYSAAQKAAGRYQREPNARLHDLMAWLDYRKAVPSDVKLQMWLAMGFLAVCVLNMIGLLLAKFLRRSGEYGVRRALGARRGSILAQCLIEAAMIGVAGGVLGLLLAWAGTWLVRKQPDDYAQLAHLDPKMMAVTFLIALGAALLAGLVPALRAAAVTPAIQLKAQ